MKTRIFFFAGVVLSIIGHSCSKDSIADTSPEQVGELTTKSAVAKLGFDTATLVIRGDDIFVEEDIVLKKSQLFKTTPRQAIIRNNSTALKVLLSSFTYFIANTVSNHRDILSGIEQMRNVLPSRVGMTRVFSEAEADLVFRGYYEVSSNCGFASWPTINWGISSSELLIGESISINLYQWQNSNASQRRTLIAHEMGHAIGIRHTNWRQYGESEFFTTTNGDGSPIVYGAYTVPNTNNTSLNPDPSSIFNGGICGRSWGSGFTQHDKWAIWELSASFF